MNNIGLVDVDGHNFPNLALMKISTYHKQRGDSVEWAFSLLPYNRIYMAKVFTFTPDDLNAYTATEIVNGGTGYDLTSKLLVMVYEKWNAPKETKRLQRWCNNKFVFYAEPDFAKFNAGGQGK